MRIRMTVEMSGTRNGVPWPKRGEIAELPTAEAAHLVGAGIAVAVADDTPVETATAPEPEAPKVPEAEDAAAPATEERRGRGRPRKPRDAEGNIVRE